MLEIGCLKLEQKNEKQKAKIKKEKPKAGSWKLETGCLSAATDWRLEA